MDRDEPDTPEGTASEDEPDEADADTSTETEPDAPEGTAAEGDPEAAEGLSTGPNMQAMNVWNSVIDDMEATAEDLADAGWETLVLHPGDVIIATKIEDPGIDTVLPNPEFESLADMVEEGVTFDEYDVFRAGQESMEYALIVAKDTETNTAVLIPLYYQVPDLAEIARGQDMVPIYLRTLEEDSVVLQLTEPGLLLPDSEA